MSFDVENENTSQYADESVNENQNEAASSAPYKQKAPIVMEAGILFVLALVCLLGNYVIAQWINKFFPYFLILGYLFLGLFLAVVICPGPEKIDPVENREVMKQVFREAGAGTQICWVVFAAMGVGIAIYLTVTGKLYLGFDFALVMVLIAGIVLAIKNLVMLFIPRKKTYESANEELEAEKNGTKSFSTKHALIFLVCGVAAASLSGMYLKSKYLPGKVTVSKEGVFYDNPGKLFLKEHFDDYVPFRFVNLPGDSELASVVIDMGEFSMIQNSGEHFVEDVSGLRAKVSELISYVCTHSDSDEKHPLLLVEDGDDEYELKNKDLKSLYSEEAEPFFYLTPLQEDSIRELAEWVCELGDYPMIINLPLYESEYFYAWTLGGAENYCDRVFGTNYAEKESYAEFVDEMLTPEKTSYYALSFAEMLYDFFADGLLFDDGTGSIVQISTDDAEKIWEMIKDRPEVQFVYEGQEDESENEDSSENDGEFSWKKDSEESLESVDAGVKL